MKIAVVGYSHITMFKEGFPYVQDALEEALGPVEVTYFGLAGQRVRKCTVNEKGVFGWHGAVPLEPSEVDDYAAHMKRINGSDHLDLSGFDVFVGIGFYALATWISGVACTVATEGIHEFKEATHTISFETYRSMFEAGKTRISDVDWLHNVPCAFRIFVAPPMPSEVRYENQSVERDECLAVKTLTQGNPCQAVIEEASEFTRAELAERGTYYLRQPPETLATRISSHRDMMGGRLAIDGSARPAGDEYHGNHLMGAAYWRAICDRILSMKAEQGGAHALGS